MDIRYSVNDADNDTLTVLVAVSNDNGATFSVSPSPTNLSGAVSENILSGSNKHIIWNAGNEGIAFNGSQFRMKVTATEKINLSFGLVAYYPFNGNAMMRAGTIIMAPHTTSHQSQTDGVKQGKPTTSMEWIAT